MGVTEGIYTQKYSYILEATNRKLESRMNFTILLLASLLSVVMGCASQQGRDDENCNGQDGCCHNGKCTEGQGDCDVNSDCKGDLSCGTNNCIGDTFDDNDDCCVDFGKCVLVLEGFLEEHAELNGIPVKMVQDQLPHFLVRVVVCV